MNKPKIKKDEIKTLLDTKFIKVYDLPYEEGNHYYDASRRGIEDILAAKDDAQLKREMPDAASAILIVKEQGEEEKLVLFYEYRYPTGQFVLSIPAGLIDEKDGTLGEEAIRSAMIREIREETGIVLKDSDRVEVVNPALFTTPGFTDETTAFVLAVADLEDLSSLNQSGAEGAEKFDGFCLVTKQEACEILKQGRDPEGRYYPLITWAALVYFVSEIWK